MSSSFQAKLPGLSMPAARHRPAPSWLVLAVVLAALGLGATRARAEDDPVRARELFQQGTMLFDVGDFDKAIAAWQQGYKAKPDPSFLYNIGQAYRFKGDPQKAIFFYRGFLRNSPKAPNRADIEKKIADLQKQIEAAKPGAPGPAPTPAPVVPPPAVTPVVTAPAPVVRTPPPAVVVKTPPPARATTRPPAFYVPPPEPVAPLLATPPVVPAAPEPAADGRNRSVDLSVALGFDTWPKGLRGKADPSFAFALAGGFTFGAAANGPASFRLGAIFSYTFLSEKASTVKFTSFLLEPSGRFRLSPDRWYLTAGLGIGGVSVGNLKTSSALVSPSAGAVNGSPGLFVLRPALGLELQLTRAWSLALSTALAWSPKGNNFYAPIVRGEFLGGLGYRF
jgi:hypothetical protein